MEERRKIIYFYSFPGAGHVNPLTGLANELSNRNYDVKFYAEEKYRTTIERTKAEFRPYISNITQFQPKPITEDDQNVLSTFLNKFIEECYIEIPYLLSHVESEHPELIIYDQYFLPGRYLLKILEKNFIKGVSSHKLPLSVCFYTCFVIKPGLYPDDNQLKQMRNSSSFWSMLSTVPVFYNQFKFCYKFGLNVFNPIDFMFNQGGKLNLVPVFPELHPKCDKYGDQYKFVGCMVSENIRKNEVLEEKLNELFHEFEPINPNFTMNTKKRLIYVSLGTIFNNNIFLFDKIIEAIRLLEDELKQKQDGFEFKCIVACGKENLKIYQQKIQNENFVLPNNLFLFEYVPQIDVLERACLYISHCGMNSASEAIQYGVPLVCIPLKYDQPLVAYRLADELNLGIRMETIKFTPEQLNTAINQVLNDKGYLERMLNISKVSRSYNGITNSIGILEEFLRNN